MRRFFLLYIVCTTLLHVHAQAPKYEMRAVWFTTLNGLDWPRSHNAETQKQELRQALDLMKAAGINTVLMQTRVRSTTIYPSAIEPWDGCLTGTPGKAPSYDALQYAIEECHKRGMQLHAWVVTIPIGKWNSLGCQQLRKKYPKMIVRLGDEGYMSPEHPETAGYIARCCKEIVTNYDVDGIHLDYIRYPETWPKAKRGKGQPGDAQKRRENITNIVRAIYQAVKSEKPWVMLSCSPIGKHDDLSRYHSGGWNARTAVSQDAQAWLRTGLMDALFPMMYFKDNNFFPFAIDWQEHSYGRIITPGLGIYFLDPKEGHWTLDVVERQMNVLRQLGSGHCFFRYKFLKDNIKDIYHFTKHFNTYPALVPPMTWQQGTPPAVPRYLTLKGNTLQWEGVSDTSGTPNLLYNIYASKDFPVDIGKAENLVATRILNNSLKVPANHQLNYAVTAQNRYGLESQEACQLQLVETQKSVASPISIIRSDTLLLPVKPSTLDAQYIAIETLQGTALSVHPYTGKTLNIAHLADGMYQLRSLGKKGHNHRIGFFSVKRSKVSR